MIEISNKFIEITLKVQKLNNLAQIISKQLESYDLQAYKIEQWEASNMAKMYESVKYKYTTTKELIIEENGWNEGERRLFVWFIVCYSYFIELNNQKMAQKHWDDLSPVFFSKAPIFLQFQYLNLLVNKKRMSWNDEEDRLLVEIVKQQTPGKWNQISKKMFYNSNRLIFKSPKHCRERWLNHLDQNKKHGSWSNCEDLIIFKYVYQNGKRWSKIVPLLNETRTEHMIKNRYNSLISKNKSNKKQKQEQITKKLIQQYQKRTQADSKDSILLPLKPEVKSVDQKMDSENKNLPQIGQIQNLPPNSYQNYNYGCYINYNTLLLINQFYCSQLASPSIVNTQQQMFNSKNSNFTLYHSPN